MYDNILLSNNQTGGASYEEVQSIAKALTNGGIILGVCSKNNQNDVEEVINNHKGMTLKAADFSIKRINWEDKVFNLIDISKTLNIGLDSLVFIDDSNFEINLFKEFPTLRCLMSFKSRSINLLVTALTILFSLKLLKHNLAL